MDEDTVSPQLLDLGREVTAQLAREVMAGASVVRLQLLACRFYEAIKAAREKTPAHSPTHEALGAAADQCKRPAITPHSLLVQVRTAVAMLTAIPGEQPGAVLRLRPQLRVIQGGLA